VAPVHHRRHDGFGTDRILHELQQRGEQVIDLEDLAQHQGSSYGTLDRLVQPSQEQFENDLAGQLHKFDRTRRIWVEDESLTIGKRIVPRTFWKNMQDAQLFEMQAPLEIRVRTLVEEYGSLNKDFLVECTERVRKRLGPEQTKRAVAAIREGRMEDFVREVLVYYDKTYRSGLRGRDPGRIVQVPVQDGHAAGNAALVLAAAAETSSALLPAAHGS
jgi:tRNA 2-selenouridine synthase